MKFFYAGDQMLVLLGMISCHINVSELTCSAKKVSSQREHQKTGYFVEGKQICRATFRFMHA